MEKCDEHVDLRINQTMKNLLIAFFYILLFGAQTTFGQNNTDIIIVKAIIGNVNHLSKAAS